MGIEKKELPDRTGTVEIGYGLRFRGTGELIRVRRDGYGTTPASFQFTTDPSGPVYLVGDIAFIAQVLGMPQPEDAAGSEVVPAFGPTMGPEDFEPVAVERVIRTRTEPVKVPPPLIFDTLMADCLPPGGVEALLGRLPEKPFDEVSPDYVCVAVRMPAAGREAAEGAVGHKVYFGRGNPHGRWLLGVVGSETYGSVPRFVSWFGDQEGLLLICTMAC
jgi:hypothetical protein